MAAWPGCGSARSRRLDPDADRGLGATVPVNRLGLGTAGIAGLFEAVDDQQATAALDAAWEAGIRRFDTAPHYGSGVAETRLGAYLKGRVRDAAVVSTKVGRLLVPPGPGDSVEQQQFAGAPNMHPVRDYSADGVRRSVEESLARTGLDRFDVLYVHDPDDHWAAAAGEAVPALARMRDEGLVSSIGVGMNQTEMLCRFVRETDIDEVLVAGRYSLLDRSATHELIPLCISRGVRLVVGGVLGSGVLADPSTTAHYNYQQVSTRVLQVVLDMQQRCAAYDVPLVAAALQLPLRDPAIGTVLLGARSAEEVHTALAMLAILVPDDLWAELDAVAEAAGVAPAEGQ
jgi:aryl-alcohol dehydrogenase-like predicted oxidoreductase